MSRLSIISGALLLSALPAAAQQADPAIGRGIAMSACAACHRVEASPDGPSPNPDAPRFADVARMNSTTELSIRVFLRSSHAAMPNFMLGAEEIDSIAAYILGLARQ